MIKIAIDTTYMDGRVAKGTSIVIRKHIEGLVKYKDKLDITLIHKFAQPNDPLYKEFKEIVIPRIWNFAFGGIINEFLFFLKYRLDIALGKKEKFDIYFLFYSRVLPSFLLAPGKKFIFHAMDGGPKTSGFHHKTKTSLTWHVLLCKRFIDRFIALTKFGQRGIMQVGKLPEKKVPIVLNGVESIYRPTNDKESAKVFISDKYKLPKNFILDVSRWDPHKNIINMVDAYKMYREDERACGRDPMPLVFVGGRHMPDYSAEVDAKIKSVGLENDIIVAPFIDAEDMPRIYQAAHCLLFPSFYEGFGLPVVEAFACGCPVLISNIDALTEVAGDAALVVDPYSVTDMARGIITLVRDVELQNTLISKGYVQATKFTWQEATKELVQVFEDVLK